jgi:teichuronic acid biosynthesis glycosyltransferase TuaH
MTSANRHLIWMAAVSWDGIRGTDRHMVSAMTRHARILWVDPPFSPITPSTRRAGLPRTFKPVISAVDERIMRLTPVALPGLSRPVMRVTTAPLVHAQVRWATRKLGIRPFAVVASHLDTVLGRWGSTVVKVLYGTDDYVAGARLAGLSADRLRSLEQRSLARADVVVAISPELADKWAALGAEPVVIPNGCNVARGSTDTLPPAVRDLPAPVVGLVGQLCERIDLDILNGIVDAGFSLLMVGPADPRWEPQRFPALIARPGVHYAGCVPAEAVPSYLAGADIGITPYAHSPFNRASFPLKTLEYLGAGLPVVSTDLPTARTLRDDLARSSQAAFGDQILALAASPADFIAAVRRMVGDLRRPAATGRDRVPVDRSPAIADHCRAFVERHSWSSRADVLANVIGLSSSSQACPNPSLARLQP